MRRKCVYHEIAAGAKHRYVQKDGWLIGFSTEEGLAVAIVETLDGSLESVYLMYVFLKPARSRFVSEHSEGELSDGARG